MRLGGSVDPPVSRRLRQRARLRHLGTFTFLNTTTEPFDQLTLADVQRYAQPIRYGIAGYKLKQWIDAVFVQDSLRVSDDLTLDLGLRYDRPDDHRRQENLAPRLGFGWHPKGDPRLAVRGGYAMYYTQILHQRVAGSLTGGLDG